MNANRTKPLLDWMTSGDPERVPVVMADARSTTASLLGRPVRTPGKSASFTGVDESPINPDTVAQCHRQYGLGFIGKIGSTTPLDALEFLPEVTVKTREQTNPDGTVRKFTTIATPAGTLSEEFVTPPTAPGYWREHLVKSDRDLAALEYLIEASCHATMDDPRVCEKTLAGFQANTAAWPAKTVLYLSIGVPAFTLTCNLFMSSETSFYLLADCPDRLEKLFELEALRSATVTGWAAQAGADVILGAINGLELYSPDIYRRYFIPQARTLYETAHRLGLRAWTHTCGRMNRLIEEDTYRQMGPDILESLSHAPLGDVDDLRRARQKLGPDIVTRGAVNVSLFYDRNLMYIRERTQTVLAETRGFRHMIGDTNDSFPPYPKENLLALIDEVEKSGRMLRLE